MAMRRISYPVEYFNAKEAQDGVVFEGTFLDSTPEQVEWNGQRFTVLKHRIRKQDLSYVVLSGGNLDRELSGLPEGTQVKITFVGMRPGKKGKPIATYEVEGDVPENYVPKPLTKKKQEELAAEQLADEPPPF